MCGIQGVNVEIACNENRCLPRPNTVVESFLTDQGYVSVLYSLWVVDVLLVISRPNIWLWKNPATEVAYLFI